MSRGNPLLTGAPSLEAMLANVAADIVQPRPEQTDTWTQSAERSLYEFLRQAWPVLEPAQQFKEGWHLGCVAEHLQAMEELEIRNLIINLPPRHCKSTLACVCLFCWAWIRQPSSQWIYCSYGEKLSERDSNKCRDLIQSGWYQARWGQVFRLRRAQNAAERFANDRRGYRIAKTVSGKAMGEGGDWLVMDDGNKPTDMRSEAHRLQVIDSWTRTMSTRGNNPKTVRKLVIQQRLGERDLTGYLIAERGGYEHLVLPAEYEPRRYWFIGARGDDGNGQRGEFWYRAENTAKAKPRDAITPTSLQLKRPELLDGPEGSGRKEEGDLLWPEQFGPEELQTLKGDLEGTGWAGQGQQRPAPVEGALIKADFFRCFSLASNPDGSLAAVLPQGGDVEPLVLPVDRLRFYQIGDTALSLKSTSSYTALVTFAFDLETRNLLIWDVFRQRLMVHEQLPAFFELREGQGLWDSGSRKWIVPGRTRPWPNALLFQAVERKASGQGLIDEALSLGKPLRGLSPGSQDKVQRAAVAVTLYGAGKVWHRGGAPWLTDTEDELLVFPNGAHDDVCLAPGTMVETDVGPVAVEAVRVGNFVRTRFGWKPVLAAGLTSEAANCWQLDTQEGYGLTGTGGHLVWVVGRGWVRLDCLAYGDKISVCETIKPREKVSSGTGPSSTGIPNPPKDICASTFGDTGATSGLPSTVQSGRATTAPFLGAMKSIIRTATRWTTTRITSFAGRLLSTAGRTRLALPPVRSFGPTWSESGRWRRPGTGRKKGSRGITSTPDSGHLPRLCVNTNAGGVATLFNPDARRERSIVHQFVRQRTAVRQGPMTRNAVALLAAERSRQIVTGPESGVAIVTRIRRIGRGPVYNLTIEGEPEFYANGLLTHNCDCISYACRLAGEDAILNASVAGPLWMDQPLNRDGTPMTLADLRASQAGVEVLNVGGHMVEFRDEVDEFGQ